MYCCTSGFHVGSVPEVGELCKGMCYYWNRYSIIDIWQLNNSSKV